MGNGNPASITNQPAPDPQETANNTEKQDDAQAISNGQSTASQSLKDNIPPPLPGDADEPRGADNASAIHQAGDSKEDSSQGSLRHPSQLPNGPGAMDSIPLEDCSIKPPIGPTIIQPGGPITEDAPQMNTHVATERKPTLSTEFQTSDLDLVSRIPGLFRLLDLYSEMGVNGAVDKIIIEQESMGRAMNTLRAGSYKGVSRINFPALDAVSVRPVGIYGSKSAIVEFLLNLGVVDATLAKHLNEPVSRAGQLYPYLRSGIYLLTVPAESVHQIPSGPTLYVIYWPEDETWDDDARTSVQKNRVTFMRFLTKLAPDMRLLLSENHTSALVWKYDTGEEDHESEEDSACDEESDEDDRFVKLEVTQRSHEEEGVQHYSGFKFLHPALSTNHRQDLEVRLVPGETSQAFVVLKALEGGLKPEPIRGVFTRSRLQSELRKHKAIVLEENFDEPAIQILSEVGALPPDAAARYEKHRVRHMKGEGGFLDIREKKLSVLQSKWPSLRKEVELRVRGCFVEVYGDMVADGESTEPDSKWTSADIASLLATVPEALHEFSSYTTERVPLKVDSIEYKSLKKHFREVQKLIRESSTVTPDDQRNLLASIATKHAEQTSASPPEKSRWNRVKKVAGSMLSKAESTLSTLRRSFSSSLDRDDLDLLNEIEKFSNDSDYDPAIRVIKESLTTWIEAQIEQAAETLSHSITSLLETATEEQTLQDYSTEQFTQCLADIRKYLAPDPTASSKISISTLERRPTVYEESKFFLHAVVSSLTPPLREHEMIQLEMKADDAQLLDEDPGHIPLLSGSYIRINPTTPVTTSILHMQLLNHGRRAFYALDSPTGTDIYLMSTHDTFRTARRQRHIPFKENRKLFFAVDEQTRLVACVYIEEGRSLIQTYIMDSDFTMLQPRGRIDELTRWYQDGPLALSRLCFFSGREEICLLELSGRIRVYSLQTETFWPSTISLSAMPMMMQSSPDGSALLVVERSLQGRNLNLRVFHHGSFGEKPSGFLLPLPDEFDQAREFTVSSLGRRKHVYLIGHQPSSASLHSISLRISKTETEFGLGLKKDRTAPPKAVQTTHNSLIDCFADVWERFPIIPAIARDFNKDRSTFCITSVCYGEQDGLPPIPRYFKAMVRDFKRRFQKPAGNRLDEIDVQVRSLADPQWLLPNAEPCRAGEWFVELVCLIPIHIAVARDNRFLPLQDGILSEDLSLTLLGSEVGEIIDAITMGPYEAILGSYMSTKPVKVVSSMGEQSVGKSFSLNHLVDTSFAGSAMRTTEGVWLSLCPTGGQVVVALDFEGVHSLERTAQEDMLLVLFNAAISNLIMFRNNFALSRNIANMFTSFQAGTRLFDPAQNPTLFKGLLAIIIKDVANADKQEIVKEFRSKFNEIVQREQGGNFITVLYDNQLAVMPWDVIESKAFYARFTKLGKELFKQRSTHMNAGEFLFTLKTLMAKLTAQDWGSIDRTIIKHRTSVILAALPKALKFGKSDLGPDGEGEVLKNYDTQQIVDSQDTVGVLYLGDAEDEREAQLAIHLKHFGTEPGREDGKIVQEYLQGIAHMRVDHVRRWIDSNLARFMPNDHADITSLFRDFERLTTNLVANVQICLSECNSCQLRCMRPRAHSVGPHDCSTSHLCIDPCDFCQPCQPSQPNAIATDSEKKMCGLHAGHDGNHICKPNVHLCGETCHLRDKRGCQESCAKGIGHKDEGHVCAAARHQCGQPCDLRGIILLNRRPFSCENLCVLPFDQPHDHHSCGDDRACPVRCELCPRYCAVGDHFHGLQAEAMHLCGQDHPCREDCESSGTCEIVQKPESVEMVYRGAYDTFSYTRYTQISRRLQCGIPIQPWQRAHPGRHIHSTDDKVIHHCEVRCSQCGYICHLPYGHPQREHETAHGSMQHAVWALEGPDGSSVEVNGHRFGAQDSGAPQLCSMYCSHRGRHAHVDFCRNWPEPCREVELEHARERIEPQPDRPKDWISHRLFWARTGFKDPYSKEDQEQFALCDCSCPGPEHQAQGNNPANPSLCVLPILHPPRDRWEGIDPSMHISNDGHLYHCPDPAHAAALFHVIFVLDCSSSMKGVDRHPLPNQPVTRSIVSRHNNRFGAVLSALFQFLCERSAAISDSSKKDAYSVIVFNEDAELKVLNDMTSSTEDMMRKVIEVSPSRGTNFPRALRTAEWVMERSWSAERDPVVIFLSDGEGRFDNDTMNGLCERAVALGKPLSFWSISFGPYSQVLRAMADVAKGVANQATQGTNTHPVPSDFRTAINTIQLTNTFSSIATSLRKNRAALINPTAGFHLRSRPSTDMHLM